MSIELDRMGQRCVAETPIGVPSFDEVRTRSRRHRRHRRVAVAALAVPFAIVVVVGGAALIMREGDRSVTVATGDDPSGPTPTASTGPRPATGECSVATAAEDAAPIVGNGGDPSLNGLARKVWPALAGELEITDVSPSSYRCSVDVATPRGTFVVTGIQAADGLWYLSGIGPMTATETGLSVTWADGTVRVGAGFDCPDCVSSDVTAFSANGVWVDHTGVPINVTIDAPGSDTNRGLLIQYRDAVGTIVSLKFIAIPPGAFAAG